MDTAKRSEQTRIHLENEKPIMVSFRKVDAIIHQVLSQQEMFIPGMQQIYENQQPQPSGSNAFDEFINKSVAARRINLL